MTHAQAARLLRLVAVIFFPTALIFASGAFASADALSVLMLDLLDAPLDGATGELTREARWLSAIGGGVFASLCAMIYFVIAPLVERGDQTARRGYIISIVIWFIIDSGGSIAAGVPANAAFNILFLALFLGPVLALKSDGQTAVAAS